MAACWRELSLDPTYELKVFAYSSSSETSFARDTMAGIDWRAIEGEERTNSEKIAKLVRAEQPDIVVIAGWLNSAYRSLVNRAEFRGVKFIMTMDTPWRGNIRQHIGTIVLRRFVQKMDAVFVTGERSYEYARQLGVADDKIHKGLYGVDVKGFGAVADRRAGLEFWPRRFMFAGRYSEEKALDLLVEAYQNYRSRRSHPFDLVCCGQGELDALLQGREGVFDRGFVQPGDLRNEFAMAGCFVLPSLFDPWPLAVVEAGAAGLPIITSAACGSAVENVRSHFNGFVVPTKSVDALCEALIAIHDKYDELILFGQRSRNLAAAYSATVWKDRWCSVCDRIMYTKVLTPR